MLALVLRIQTVIKLTQLGLGTVEAILDRVRQDRLAVQGDDGVRLTVDQLADVFAKAGLAVASASTEAQARLDRRHEADAPETPDAPDASEVTP